MLDAADSEDIRKEAGECARCHVISMVEWGYSRHRSMGADCKACHGESKGHVADERNNVKPDRLPRRSAIANLCLECHKEGCPQSQQRTSCQQCHHAHALLDPRKPAATQDDRLQQLSVHWQRHAQLMSEGEQLVKALKWPEARKAFVEALKEKSGDRVAGARIKMCDRRIKPELPGFEIVGNAFDDISGLPLQVRIPELNLPMLLVPGGEFELGSDQFALAKPIHTIRLESFYLARHELTQKEWRHVMELNPSMHQGPKYPDANGLPVEQISWQDCQLFLQKLNQQIAGASFRLPTEPEWEFVARAGGESGEAFELMAPRVVEKGTPNRLGFYDMAGNVREWCSSALVAYPYSAAGGSESPPSSIMHVLRGSAFIYPSSWYHPVLRYGERPNRRLCYNGFRLARSIPEGN